MTTCKYSLRWKRVFPLQVDAGLTFNKKDLEHSFIFDIKTIDRVFYLVADTEEEMNKWVRCICDICGFNPTDDGKDWRLIAGYKSLMLLINIAWNLFRYHWENKKFPVIFQLSSTHIHPFIHWFHFSRTYFLMFIFSTCLFLGAFKVLWLYI